MSDGHRISLSLFGRFDITRPGGETIQIASRQRRALLAYLALRPDRDESRERLATLFWGDSSDSLARQSLRQCLVGLRRDLEHLGWSPLIGSRERIGLDSERITTDVQRFTEEAAQQALPSRIAAARLFRGNLLDGLDGLGEGFDDWLAQERARLFATAAALLASLESAALDHAGSQAAIGLGERLAAIDPYREDVQRNLIRLRATYQGREAGLAQADHFVRLLASDMAAKPEKETRDLIETLRTVPPNAAPAPTPEPSRGAMSQADAIGNTPASAPPPNPQKARRFGLNHGLWAAASTAALALIAALFFMSSPADRPDGDMTGTQATRPLAEAPPSPWVTPSLVPGAAIDNARFRNEGYVPIAVLPLTTADNASPDERRLADRIADDLNGDLSRVPGFRVISRSTSRLFRGRDIDVAAVGQELGVRYVIDGTVQSIGDLVRINVGLTDTATRLKVWDERFDTQAADRDKAQDDILRGIARRLQVSVRLEEGERARTQSPVEADIGALLARGWAGMVRIPVDGTIGEADRFFENALARRPDNVSARLGYAASQIAAESFFLLPPGIAQLDRAEIYLADLIRENPTLSIAVYYRGLLHKLRGNPRAALADFRTVVEMNPSYALAYAQIGDVMARMGDPERAMEHIRYAIRLSPRDPAMGTWTIFGGLIELDRRNDQSAVEWLQRAVELSPRIAIAHVSLAIALSIRGDGAGAERHVAKARKISPHITADMVAARSIGLSLPGHEPRRFIDHAKRLLPSETITPASIRN